MTSLRDFQFCLQDGSYIKPNGEGFNLFVNNGDADIPSHYDGILIVNKIDEARFRREFGEVSGAGKLDVIQRYAQQTNYQRGAKVFLFKKGPDNLFHIRSLKPGIREFKRLSLDDTIADVLSSGEKSSVIGDPLNPEKG